MVCAADTQIAFQDMMPNLPDEPVADPELGALFTACARRLYEAAEPAAFLAWIAQAGPEIAPALAAQVVAQRGLPDASFKALGVAIYNAIPDPDGDFRRRKLRVPGRNELCVCGSGRKYKQCCMPAVRLPDPRAHNMLRHMLDALPASRFAELPGSAAPVFAVADAALQWIDEGQATRAAALLEPWFAGDGPLADAVTPLFDALLDCYAAQDREHVADRLIEQVRARGDRPLRTDAMLCRSLRLALAGKFDAAWEEFREARALMPSHEGLVETELRLLLLRGDLDEASNRAGYWLTRLQQTDDPELDDLIDFVLEVRDDPAAVQAELRGEVGPSR